MTGRLANLIVLTFVKRVGNGSNAHASPQPVDGSLRSRIIGMPFQELGKHGLGVCPAAVQDQQSRHVDIRLLVIWICSRRLLQPQLGIVPIVLSSGD